MRSDTRVGDFRVLAGETLTGFEGRLVVMTHDGGVAEVKLPDALTDRAIYSLQEGGADATLVTVSPMAPARAERLKLSGACNPGDLLVPAAINGVTDGMVQALPATGGTYRVVAIAEEVGVDGQLVLCRPSMMSNVTVL